MDFSYRFRYNHGEMKRALNVQLISHEEKVPKTCLEVEATWWLNNASGYYTFKCDFWKVYVLRTGSPHVFSSTKAHICPLSSPCCCIAAMGDVIMSLFNGQKRGKWIERRGPRASVDLVLGDHVVFLLHARYQTAYIESPLRSIS